MTHFSQVFHTTFLKCQYNYSFL